MDKDLPPHAMDFFYLMKAAKTPVTSGYMPKFDNNSLVVNIGSRPPNWP
jgi:hypothetical protein